MKTMSDKSHRHSAYRETGLRGGRKTPEALDRLHSDIAQTIRDLYSAIQNALKIEYKRGERDGKGFIRQVAQGEISFSDLQERL